jgi:hypothetical protein
LDPLDGIFTDVQFTGQGYFIFIIMHGSPPMCD